MVEKSKSQKRFFVLYGIVTTFFVIIVLTLFSMQIENGAYFREESDAKLMLSKTVTASRGEITDRYGRPLVTNRTGYFVEFLKKDTERKDQNQSFLNLIHILGDKRNVCRDLLPISEFPPFSFEDKESKEKEKIAQIKEKNGLDTKATAQDVLNALCKRYDIDKTYTKEEQRLLCGLWYSAESEGLSLSTPFVLIEDADPKTVVSIKENASLFPEIVIAERFVREYCYPQTAVHLLGRVGKISSEEYNAHKNDGYKQNDYVGKQGVEKAFESYLRGEDGVSGITKDIAGQTVQFVDSKDPVSGNTVMLTIDIDLQLTAEEALASAQKENGGKDGGAAVVIDVNSGEILSSASFPTYDITQFQKNYNHIAKDASKPMFNRAFAGLYEPGSTFKPIAAIAAIDGGTLGAKETIRTKGEYRYLDRTFRCHLFRTKKETHGTIDVSRALGVSCNYFFYEVGRRTGIEAISHTAELYGLGSLTGAELLGEEAKGKMATPENRKKSGGTWYPGDVLQAAIGQSDSLFTPLQLANYAATLANGGTNYKTTLLKAIVSPRDLAIIKESTPEIRQETGSSTKALAAVKDGMLQVTKQGGTAYSVFSDFPISVAGKTGSAQVKNGTNGLFICYAPAENPQIAVSVVLENGDSGTKAAQVACKILKQYFEKVEISKQDKTEDAYYTLLP